jgi:glycosyltransferase involved in cell wall biosynthesis
MKNNQKNIVVVSNGVTPYGVHFISKVSNELTEYRITTIYSYEHSMGCWQIELPSSINSILLGKGEYSHGNSGSKYFFKELLRGKEIIREIASIDRIAVTVLGYGNISHALVIVYCKLAGIPCLLMADSNILNDNCTGLKKVIKMFVLKRLVSLCSAILPCGSLGVRYFLKYGARMEHIFLVPVEPDYLLIENTSPIFISKIAEEYGLKNCRRRFIYSGRLVPIKRVDLLIDAFVKLAEVRSEWDLLIAGSGPLELSLRQRVPDRLRERIIWTGLIDNTETMAALYKLSDVLVLPSDFEQWALVVNEATCANLALVCSSIVGAAAELLHDGENGRFFQASNLASLIDALLDVTETKNLEEYKAMSGIVLQEWRNKADPIVGFHHALKFACTN